MPKPTPRPETHAQDPTTDVPFSKPDSPVSIPHYGGCSVPEVIGVEYAWDTPEHYDGVSEWFCSSCSIRIGRWTGNVLRQDEVEPVYGRGRITIF